MTGRPLASNAVAAAAVAFRSPDDFSVVSFAKFSVVVKSQIRTVLQAFRDALFTELFPGRTLVPKTLIFCKDDSHADDIVRICRETFEEAHAKGKVDDAAAAFSTALSLDPASEDAATALGSVLADAGKLAEAEAALTALADLVDGLFGEEE